MGVWSGMVFGFVWMVGMGVVKGMGPLGRLVDTRNGAGGVGFGIGSTNPGPQYPSGAMRVGPDSSLGLEPFLWIPFDHFGGYYAEDDEIRAFSHTHMVGPGALDWGNVGVMVARHAVVPSDVNMDGLRAKLDKDSEVAEIGMYAVNLTSVPARSSIAVAGQWSAVHEHECFPVPGATEPCRLFVDICHTTSSINDSATCPQASVQIPGQFPSAFGASVLNHGGLSERSPIGGVWVHVWVEVEAKSGVGVKGSVWKGMDVMEKAVSTNTSSGMLGVAFEVDGVAPSDGVTWVVRVGLSFLSQADAKHNLAVEQGGDNPSVSEAATATATVWEEWLGRVSVAGGTATDKATLYSMLWHAGTPPTNYVEHSGDYLTMAQPGPSRGTWNGSAGATYVSDLSIWDIHRTFAPLVTLIAPSMSSSLVQSLLDMHTKGGQLPRWPLANVYTGCMVGSHGTAILADAAMKGVAGVDVKAAAAVAIDAVDAQANNSDYDALGYVPIERGSNAAGLTLAYAFDDGITARLAQLANRGGDAKRLEERSHNWENVMNGTEPYPCPRNSSGDWQCSDVDKLLIYPFETHFVEGDGEEYRFFVNHEVDRLVQRFGSNASFAAALETYFNNTPGWIFDNALPNPYEWIGNEPTLAHPFLFPFAGNKYAYLTQKWARWVAQTYFSPAPDGLPGNDDFGAISGFYTFASFGFYPFTGTGLYSLASPIFDNITISLPPHEFLIFHGIDPTLWGDVASITTKNIPLLQITTSTSSSTPYASGACANHSPLPTALLPHATLFGDARKAVRKAFEEKDIVALVSTKPATLYFERSEVPVTWGNVECK